MKKQPCPKKTIFMEKINYNKYSNTFIKKKIDFFLKCMI